MFHLLNFKGNNKKKLLLVTGKFWIHKMKKISLNKYIYNYSPKNLHANRVNH